MSTFAIAQKLIGLAWTIAIGFNVTVIERVQVEEIQLRHVSVLLVDRGYGLVISPEVRAYLAEVGYNADYGGAIQRELQDPLAVKILSGEFHEGETIYVECAKEAREFTAQATDQPVAA